jgi:hypothetical protein
MQLVTYRPGASAVWADALFASMLQRSDGPSAGQVRKAVAAAARAYGSRGCAERVAQEFGDHPEAAVARMRWARGVVAACPGRSARSVEQAQHVFHELHADGRNALCVVCDSQYGSA